MYYFAKYLPSDDMQIKSFSSLKVRDKVVLYKLIQWIPYSSNNISIEFSSTEPTFRENNLMINILVSEQF